MVRYVVAWSVGQRGASNLLTEIPAHDENDEPAQIAKADQCEAQAVAKKTVAASIPRKRHRGILSVKGSRGVAASGELGIRIAQ